MSKRAFLAGVVVGSGVLILMSCREPAPPPAASTTVFNVKDDGANGIKDDLAQEAIQKAIDACSAAGGGTVLFPPGDYTTGMIHLRSHVRLYLEGGATVYSLHDRSRFDKEALLYGEDLVGVTIEGRGVFNGEGAYDRRLKGDHEDDFIRPNQVAQECPFVFANTAWIITFSTSLCNWKSLPSISGLIPCAVNTCTALTTI